MQPMGIEEHPLIVMDCTLSNPQYMNLDEDAALDHCHRVLAATRRHNGEFVLLWHNTTLGPAGDNYAPRFHRQLLPCLERSP